MQEAAATFGRVCAARVDFDQFPKDIPPHPWDGMLPPDLQEQLAEPGSASSDSEDNSEL